MKRAKKITIISIAFIMGLAFGGYLLVKNQIEQNSNKSKSPVFKEQISADKMLNIDEMRADLDYLVQTLKNVHPKSYNGLTDGQKSTIDDAYEKINEPMRAGDFYFVANEIICAFRDAHTNLYLKTNSSDKVIDVPIIWLNDGMYVLADNNTLKKGDKILSIGQKKPNDLLEELSKIIPTENEQWVRVMASDYIIKEPYLNYLELIQGDAVSLEIQRGDKELDAKIPLVNSDKASIYKLTYSSSDDKDWVSYSIDEENSLGIFKLDKCRNDDEYKEKLNKFFVDVFKKDIQNIAVDVRNNSGGDSSVINEFIGYLDIDYYKSFGGEIRYSKEGSDQNGYRKKSGYKSFKSNKEKNKKVQDDKLIFKGNTYILTSPITFSSGNWFAVIFKDNNIGTIIGEPTGNQPSSYGDILSFQLPNSRYKFQISHKKWVRPNTDNDPEDALIPDVIVYTKIEDILNDSDSQVEKLKEIVNTKK